jgi:hypothetical protein
MFEQQKISNKLTWPNEFVILASMHDNKIHPEQTLFIKVYFIHSFELLMLIWVSVGIGKKQDKSKVGRSIIIHV